MTFVFLCFNKNRERNILHFIELAQARLVSSNANNLPVSTHQSMAQSQMRAPTLVAQQQQLMAQDAQKLAMQQQMYFLIMNL